MATEQLAAARPAAAADLDSKPGPLTRLLARLFEPIDIGLLVFFRVAFGGIMLWETVRYFQYGWVEANFVEPAFHFTYYGFSWVRPWPGDGMTWHFAVLGALALCIMLGLFYRVASVLFFLAFTYVFLLDQSYYLNHFYLISLVSFLMIFLPVNRAQSLDAVMRPSIRTTKVPAWTLWILRFQIGVAYFYGGIAKLNPDWLSGTPAAMMISDQLDFPIVGRYFHEDWMVMTVAYGGLLLDLLIVPLLLWRRTLVPAFLLAVGFHLSNSILFRIGIFPWMMIAATLLFCPPEWVQITEPEPAKKKGKAARKSREAPPAAPFRPTGRQLLVAQLLWCWVLFQTLVPFRHVLYPGNVSWTEEGHRFAWHMKLRVKRPEGAFYGRLPDGTVIDEPDWRQYLNSKQRRTMLGRPDMALQYAHFLAGEFRKQGHDDVAVSAEILCSLNGREPRLLIDPEVDLSRVPRNLAHADWILPLGDDVPLDADMLEQMRAAALADRR